jgi:transketolase
MSSQKIATRRAYGEALVKLGEKNQKVVVLDAETSNSTFAELFKNVYRKLYCRAKHGKYGTWAVKTR